MMKNKFSKKLLESKALESDKALKSQLSKKYMFKPYHAKWRKSYLAANGYTWLSNSFSFTTGAFAASFFLALNMASLPSTIAITFGVIIGVSVGVLIELGKRTSNENYFEDGYNEGIWSPSTLVAMLFLSSVSVGLSFYGSYKLPTVIGQQIKHEELYLKDTAQIANTYNTDIAALQASVNQTRKENTRSNGRITYAVAKELANMEKSLEALRKKRRTALEEAQSSNQETIQQAKEQSEMNQAANGLILGWITIGTEIFFILAFWFKEHYLYNAFAGMGVERRKYQMNDAGDDEGTGEEEPEGENPTFRSDPDPNQRTVVHGFKKYGSGNDLNITKPPLTNDTKGHNTPITPKVEFITLKNTYTHTKEDSTTVEYPMWKLKQRVKQYATKVENSKKKIQSGDKTKDWDSLLQNQEAVLKYWENAVQVLEEQLQKMEGAK